MQVTRFTTLPPGIHALTATARGMVDNTMTRAAQSAFGELMTAVGPTGLMAQVRSQQPDLRLNGTLAWQTLAPGRYATLNQAWHAIYADWLPASGITLRDAPPLELCINTPQTAPP